MTERGIRGGRVARTAPLVGLAGRTAGEAVVASLRRRMRGDGPDPDAAARRAAELWVERLGHSKGVLMKAGQMMSFVGFSVDGQYESVFQQALARLQDDAPPMPPETAAAQVEAELGAPPGEVFAEFEAEPVAAASIGQVHRAVTRDGRRVAVKVQYPGVDGAIRADLANAELLATFFQIGHGLVPGAPRLDVRSIAGEVSERIGDEIDYLTEARHQQEFADHYRGHPFVRVPEVVHELTTRRVLTMDFVEGIRHRDALEAGQDLKDRWGEVLYRFYLGSIRRLGLFHADPHPGNYLFHEDGTVTFLDFGCVKHFSSGMVRYMRDSAEATAAGDAERLLRIQYARGGLDPADPPPADQVLAWWRAAFRSCTGPQPYTFSPAAEAENAREQFAVLGPHGAFLRRWKMDPDMTTLSRIQLGMSAVLSQLRATGEWEGIRREWDRNGPPATELGELERAFWGENVALWAEGGLHAR
ncbi:AarF/ABC1/UbiB kinase family protein [Actinomadura sp. BRA 177]|uniref:ABC1 kinase family protein n=1 Tax=Actinomadura sp. BRA 177 TaxID=2745202 RepID=UPI001596033C|nr:AarF/ABC1/UbiB kinase family protein [Actinomadura sp. BRA 177]NVI91734.1 AarF/ABC1/UbiB kinase family protein [Actinomadura sp. BRA 177]